MGRRNAIAAKQTNTTQAARFEAAREQYRVGKADKAKTLCRQVIRKQADHAGALHLLGMMAWAEGRLPDALELLSRAAAVEPENPAFLCDLGNALKAADRHAEAVEMHERVAALLPDSPEAHSNLGIAYGAWGRHDEAVDHLRRVVSLRPADAELHHNLGNALMATGQWEDAEPAFRHAVETDPGHIHARANLGIVLKYQGRLDESIACLRDGIARLDGDALAARDPRRAEGYVSAGWNLGLSLLMAGDWAEGWKWYEERRYLADFAMPRIDGPAWDGAPLDGRTLLIHEEQGLGDTIQFARYVPLVARIDKGKGGCVVFRCQKPLNALMTSLLTAISGEAELIGPDAALPPYDLQAPLMSLPRLLDRPEPFWPEGGPYLAADPALVREWMDRLGANRLEANRLGADGFKVGIAWQGNPGYSADAARSLPLDCFRPLAELSGVRLFGLQKGHGEDQLDTIDWRDRITPLGHDLDNGSAFLDTAAVMASLDLVVTSDTSIAHLAGALGVPVWVPLAHVPDWRWGVAEDVTPWYPTMRLFRQEKPGDWAGVMERVATGIEAL